MYLNQNPNYNQPFTCASHEIAEAELNRANSFTKVAPGREDPFSGNHRPACATQCTQYKS